VKRQHRVDDLTDAALVAFVQWCRTNETAMVEDAVVARRVLHAYVDVALLQREEEAVT
jgi:hypothetical protein